MNCQHLIKLAEGWRTKADYLKKKYGGISPNLTNHVVTALETCAQELEDEIRAAVAVEPLQPLNPSTLQPSQ